MEDIKKDGRLYVVTPGLTRGLSLSLKLDYFPKCPLGLQIFVE